MPYPHLHKSVYDLILAAKYTQFKKLIALNPIQMNKIETKSSYYLDFSSTANSSYKVVLMCLNRCNF